MLYHRGPRITTAYWKPNYKDLYGNRPFAASQSRGTKPPYWRANVALGQDKQRKLPFKIMYAFCLSCPSATFALQYGGFVPREWIAAKGLFILRSTKRLKCT